MMAKLTAAERDELPGSAFALSMKRMFPIHDRIHAQKALQLLPRAVSAGSVTAAEAEIVRRKAQAKIAKD